MEFFSLFLALVVMVATLGDALPALENRGICPSPPPAWGSHGTKNCYSSSPSPNCGTVTSYGVSASDKQLIVSAHNSWRARVASGQETRGNPGPQPKASNMRRMVYVRALYSDRSFNVSFLSAGQNLYMSWGSSGSKPNWTAAVKAWYDEVALFSKFSISPFKFTMDTGHYTQVVWADTYAVGCGYVAYKGGYQLYVCNYGPAGNYIGMTVYGDGAPCSCCKSTCSNGVLCD
ncbi:unnamed protein product [Darwinula stevensoni]|uniref:SCP domain-containing protein n=1 Tax=Darwinula stevensoni TaxID=69355 RepID=A0A7R9AG86_9CRUS|nr:unnamed protein product [Darwinula stevensoni]CAG0903171.1 unnamed protein product [Darwinula stevensoni]